MDMEAPPSPPWADLHQDLLGRIFGRIDSIVVRACFAGACSHWRLTAAEAEYLAPLLPWQLRPSTGGDSYLIVFGRTITDLPALPDEARGSRFCGSIPGAWFVVARDQWRGYALLNLRSGEQIPLPDVVRDNQVPYALRGDSRRLVILSATISATPTPHGHYSVAAICSGQSRIAFWMPGMRCWCADLDEDPEEEEGDRAYWRQLTQETDYEDLLYYRCAEQEGFFFLTSEEDLVVFRPEYNLEHGELFVHCIRYRMPDTSTTLPRGVRVLAGRYLVESAGRLLMVKRYVSPGHGTVSFHVFMLQWRNQNNPYWHGSSTVLSGQLLFIGRGCSRSFQTGRPYPGFIYFLDDTDGFRDVQSIVLTQEYRCGDTGWCRYFSQYVEKRWPEGRSPDCSPWIWMFH